MPPPRGRRDDRPPPGDGQWARLFIGAGRRAGMRPADVVGAIANEAQVSGRSVGAIQIADDYTLVDVPEADADLILRALARGSVRGRSVPVRRDR